jgi:hypothetical protein
MIALRGFEKRSGGREFPLELAARPPRWIDFSGVCRTGRDFRLLIKFFAGLQWKEGAAHLLL